MMYTKINIVWLLISVFSITCCNNEPTIDIPKEKIRMNIAGKSIEISLAISAKSQETYVRKWRDIETEFIFKIGGLADTTFYLPTKVKTDTYNNIYVLDMEKNCVNKFNKNGKFIKKFGRKGRGPGEFVSPFRFDISHSGKLVILDPNLNKCEIFEKNNISSVKCRFTPTDVCFIGEDDIAILQLTSVIDNSIIRKFNIKTGKTNEYQNVIQTQKLGDITFGALPFLQGSIISYNYNKIVYVPRYMNFFINYSDMGEIEQGIKTIDETNLPNIKQKTFKLTEFRLPVEFLSAIDATIVDNLLLIWSAQKTIEMKKPVIDFYDIEEGNYLYSIELENSIANVRVSEIHFTSENYFMLNEKSELEVYRYSINGDAYEKDSDI